MLINPYLIIHVHYLGYNISLYLSCFLLNKHDCVVMPRLLLYHSFPCYEKSDYYTLIYFKYCAALMQYIPIYENMKFL